MSALLKSGRFYPGETPIFKVRFRLRFQPVDATPNRVKLVASAAKGFRVRAGDRRRQHGTDLGVPAGAMATASATFRGFAVRGISHRCVPKLPMVL